MSHPSPNQVTELLRAWSDGDQSALDQLIPLVYGELHRIARRLMAREQPGHSLQATALINEVYLRLIDRDSVSWHDRAHFFAASAQMMRHILVDFARKKRFLKRGGGALRVSVGEAAGVTGGPEMDLLALHEALTALAAFDQRKGQVVELKFFGGLSVAETAAVLGVSEETVLRDWKLAKAWLRKELRREGAR